MGLGSPTIIHAMLSRVTFTSSITLLLVCLSGTFPDLLIRVHASNNFTPAA